MDCFAEPVIGRRFAPTRWLATTATQANWLFENRIRSLMNEAIRNDRDVDIGFRVHSLGPRIQRVSSRIIVAAFSAIIAVGVLVFPEVIVGMTEASATRSPEIP